MLPSAHRAPERLVLSACEVDLAERVVRRDGEAIVLAPKEADVLAYLVARAGRVVTREDLERDVWGYREGVDTQTVGVCIRRLRSKIERDSRRPDHLRTVRGTGWVLHLAAAVDAARGGVVTVWGPGGAGKTRWPSRSPRLRRRPRGASSTCRRGARSMR